MSTIGEVATTAGWRGSGTRTAEPGNISTLQSIDLDDHSGQAIDTSVDCYVTGEYDAGEGKMFRIRQRYTIFIRYGPNTQSEALARLRKEIVSDFERRYPGFDALDIDIPPLRAINKVDSMGVYGGSETFREMTRVRRATWDIFDKALGLAKGKGPAKSPRNRYFAESRPVSEGTFVPRWRR
jgi:hypothetical protein